MAEAAVLVDQTGAAIGAANPLAVAGVGCTITKTVLVVTAASQQLIGANPARKYLAWMVLGTQPVTIEPGAAAAVVGTGFVYNGGGNGSQGGSEEYQQAVPTNAFQAIAAATGSTVIVWEGV